MRRAPSDTYQFWLYCGQDTKSSRLQDTWDWLELHNLWEMPEVVDTKELSTGMTLVEEDQVILTLYEEKVAQFGLLHLVTATNLQPNAVFRLPKGMLTDGATIPWWARAIAAPKGVGFRAAMLHDMLTNDAQGLAKLLDFYVNGKPHSIHIPAQHSWNWKAELYYYALRYCGFGHARAYIMYRAVVFHGRNQL